MKELNKQAVEASRCKDSLDAAWVIKGTGEPTEAEIKAADIDFETYKDVESWGDKERAFYWRWRYEESSERSSAARWYLAEILQVAGLWETIIPEIERRLSDKTKSV